MKMFVLAYAPSGILLLIWFYLHKRESIRRPMALASIAVFIILAIIGALDWASTYEVTQLGAALSFTSSIWFTGPLLTFAVNSRHELTWPVVFSCIVLPPLSIVIGFFLLAMMRQVSGM